MDDSSDLSSISLDNPTWMTAPEISPMSEGSLPTTSPRPVYHSTPRLDAGLTSLDAKLPRLGAELPRLGAGLRKETLDIVAPMPVMLCGTTEATTLSLLIGVFYLFSIFLSISTLSHSLWFLVVCLSLLTAVLLSFVGTLRESAKCTIPLLMVQLAQTSVFVLLWFSHSINEITATVDVQVVLVRLSHFSVVYSVLILSSVYAAYVTFLTFNYYRSVALARNLYKQRITELAFMDLNDDLVIFDRSDSLRGTSSNRSKSPFH